LEPLAARCAADRLVREFTADELGSPAIDPARVQQVMAPASPDSPCRRERRRTVAQA
jgi:hypothetical protein